MKQINILVLAFGPPDRSASTIYRIAQYEELFNARNIKLHYIPKQEIGPGTILAARKADIVINQKCFINKMLGRLIASASKRLVLDFDDAIWARPGRAYHTYKLRQIESRLKWWANASAQVIVANSYLANHLAQKAGHVSVVPMSLDLRLWSPLHRENKSNEEVIMGWAGSPVSFPYLESIAPALRAALEQNPNLRLAVYSGKRPRLNMPFEYIPFEYGTEHLFIRKLDIGLLPLADDESARGKSPMKAIQYLACAVPVVGNIVGATSYILKPTNSISVDAPDQWVAAINKLVRDISLKKQMGLSARKMAEDHFDRNKVGHQFISLVLGKTDL